MSVCTCPRLDYSEWEDLFTLMGMPEDWNLLRLADLYRAGNSVYEIASVVPFRNNCCNRTNICCGQCTRQCYHRCVQDSLNRLYMWRHLVENTPTDQQERIPLSIRLIVNQKFDSAADLSWAVGDIVSASRNSTVKSYMDQAHTSHPYKFDYAPQYAIDQATGKRVVNRLTGELKVLEWPQTGMCPFCTVNNTVDRRYGGRSLIE